MVYVYTNTINYSVNKHNNYVPSYDSTLCNLFFLLLNAFAFNIAVDQESSFFLSVLQYFAEKVPLIAAIKETSMLGIMQIDHVEEILGT